MKSSKVNGFESNSNGFMKKVSCIGLIFLLAGKQLQAVDKMANYFSKEVVMHPVIFTDSAALENEYIRVMQKKAVCTSSYTPNYGTRVIVALGHCKIKSSRGIVKLKRGNIAVFREEESYNSPGGDFFEVAFKKKYPPLKQPEKWIAPLKNTTVYEDEQFRVFEERLAPGDDRELHSHAQSVVVRLNEVQLTDPRFYPKGQPGTGIQVPNTVRFAEPVIHAVRNLSKIPLFNIVIEFKIPH